MSSLVELEAYKDWAKRHMSAMIARLQKSERDRRDDTARVRAAAAQLVKVRTHGCSIFHSLHVARRWIWKPCASAQTRTLLAASAMDLCMYSTGHDLASQHCTVRKCRGGGGSSSLVPAPDR